MSERAWEAEEQPYPAPYVRDLEAELAAERETIKELRLQLRNAWARLECRCLFNDDNTVQHTDDHCPYHGSYYGSGDDYWPIAAERERAEKAERERDAVVAIVHEDEGSLG